MIDQTPRRSLGFRGMLAAIMSLWFAALAGVPTASAQCLADWRPGEGHPGVTGERPVWTSIPWDPDGAGPRPEVLIVAGGFEGAGNVAAPGIASWDGSTWSALGTGLGGDARALAVYNGDLIVAGNFFNAGGVPVNLIARWDGTSWHPLGSGLNGMVRALAVADGQLYAGGFFTQAGGTPARGIARWNGSSWQSLGAAVNTVVTALGVSGGKLIVGGDLQAGIPATRIASWNGSTWSSLDGPSSERIFNVEGFSEYHGQLIAAATFLNPTSGSYLRRVARWDGTAWRSMGTGANGAGPDDSVIGVTPYRGDLYVGGIFAHAGGVSTPGRMARWNGSDWSSVPLGLGMPGRQALSLTVFGDDLIAGGLTTRVDGEQMSEVGRFDGTRWMYMSGGMNEVVTAVASYRGDLYLGGYFSQAGKTGVSAIARRSNDGSWDDLKGGLSGDCCSGAVNPVDSMVVYQDSLVIAGAFTAAGGIPISGVARWNGESWSAFGNARVSNLILDGANLYGTIGNGLPTTVVQWNPATQQWTSLGSPHDRAMILALGVFNGELIAGGFGFDPAPAAIYRWDGTTWHPMGSTSNFNWIEDLAVYNGELIATGRAVEGLIRRWTGSSWQLLGGGLQGTFIWDLHLYNGALIAGGEFSVDGSTNFDHIARWDGSSWSTMGAGPNDDVVALGVHNGDLVAGGWFTTAGGRPNGHWARFGVACASSPSAASDPLEGLPPMIVTGYNRSSGVVSLSYGPACGAIDHVVHAGPLDRVASYGYDLSQCGLGSSGTAQVNVGPGSRFWIIAGRNEGVEGSAGRDSAGHERPAHATGACSMPQQLGGTCP